MHGGQYQYQGYPKNYQSPWTFPMPSEKERDLRWETIRRYMRKNDLDCLIVSTPAGFMPVSDPYLYYISNFVPFVNRGIYLVFPLEGIPQLGVADVNGPQFLHCALETSWVRDIVAATNPGETLIKRIQSLNLNRGKLGIIGIDSDTFPASHFRLLSTSFPEINLVDATKMLDMAMNEVSRTSDEELVLLRQGSELLDLSCEAIAKAFKPGVSELELWAAAEYSMLKNGGWIGHFILGMSGPKVTFPRAPASHRIVNPGDVALFEINSNFGGIYPQSSYAFSLGEPNQETLAMFDFCQELYGFSLQELEKKRTFREIDNELVKRIHDAGYEPLAPQIHRYNLTSALPKDSPAQPGDYFTVHPSVADKAYTMGAKLGDVVRMGLDGKIERLSRIPAKLIIV